MNKKLYVSVPVLGINLEIINHYEEVVREIKEVSVPVLGINLEIHIPRM